MNDEIEAQDVLAALEAAMQKLAERDREIANRDMLIASLRRRLEKPKRKKAS